MEAGSGWRRESVGVLIFDLGVKLELGQAGDVS